METTVSTHPAALADCSSAIFRTEYCPPFVDGDRMTLRNQAGSSRTGEMLRSTVIDAAAPEFTKLLAQPRTLANQKNPTQNPGADAPEPIPSIHNRRSS